MIVVAVRDSVKRTRTLERQRGKLVVPDNHKCGQLFSLNAAIKSLYCKFIFLNAAYYS